LDKYRLVTEVVFDKEENKYMIFSDPSLVYTTHKIAENIPSYEEIVKVRMNIYDTGDFIYIRGPLRIASGVFFMINDFVLLTLRDSQVRFYPNKMNDFAGHVGMFGTPLHEGMRELYEEILIYDEKSNEIIVPVLNIDKFESEISHYITTSRIVSEILNIDIGENYREVSVKIDDEHFDEIPRIEFYDNCKLVEEINGFLSIDKKTNSVEITIPVLMKYDVNRISTITMEPLGSPAILLHKKSFLTIKDDYLTPRVRSVRKYMRR